MKVVALVSGGKDSLFNLMKCVAYGHDIVALANLYPQKLDELDSYMYQTVGHNAIELYSEAIQLPLYREPILGSAKSTGSIYHTVTKDEVEDLYSLLSRIKDEIDYDAVSVGAVLSNYQRIRVEHVCTRLGLKCVAFLWRLNQRDLLSSMIDNQVDAILIKVASLGLSPQKHLGKDLSSMYSHLCNLEEKYGCHVCGEGGEYETLTLDCPLFVKKIELVKTEVVVHSDDAFAQVGYLRCLEMNLKDKGLDPTLTLLERLKGLPMMTLTKPCLIDARNIENDQITIIDKDDGHNSQLVEIINQIDTEQPKNDCCHDLAQNADYAFVSNILCWKMNNNSVEEHSKRTFTELKDMLMEMGSTIENVLMVYLYVADMSQYPIINSVYGSFFEVAPPARVCLQSYPDHSDEIFRISCIALKNSQEEIKPLSMHVQTISDWAPANIGPYSQSIVCNGLVYISGCIGLIPSTMELATSGLQYESILSLTHVQSIAEASNANELCDVVSCFCYVVNKNFVEYAHNAWNKVKSDDSIELQCFVIPKLPRNANFEWHLTIPSVSSQSRIDDSHRFRLIKSNQKQCIVHFFGNVSSSLFVEGNTLDELLIVRNLKTALLRYADEAQLSICFLQLMYNRNRVKVSYVSNIKQVIQSTLLESFNCQSSISILACDWLYNGDIFLSYHGLKRDSESDTTL